MTTSTDLHYAPKPPLLRRARVRGSFVLAVIVAVVSAGLLWGKPAWSRVQLLYWQSRCMTYEVPPDVVVSSSGGTTAHTPREWSTFYALATAGGLKSEGTAFLHRLENVQGPRLVVVDVYSRGFSRTLVARAFVPGTLFSKPAEIPGGTDYMEGVPLDAVVYCGEPDGNDRSHFTIRYEVAGRACTLDGWLTDDDRVLLEERRQPIAGITP